MMSLDTIQITLRDVSDKLGVGRCERCNSSNAKLWPSMTAYSTAGMNLDLEDDPNAKVFLCHCCHEDYVEYWTEMWNEYKSSQGG
jgi:hypothetical protein